MPFDRTIHNFEIRSGRLKSCFIPHLYPPLPPLPPLFPHFWFLNNFLSSYPITISFNVSELRFNCALNAPSTILRWIREGVKHGSCLRTLLSTTIVHFSSSMNFVRQRSKPGTLVYYKSRDCSIQSLQQRTFNLRFSFGFLLVEFCDAISICKLMTSAGSAVGRGVV